MVKHSLAICIFLLAAIGCTERLKQKQLILLSEEETGIGFVNSISARNSLNIVNYIYFYNGAGVGVGDINNDGLEDLFFAGNQVSSRLYLNQGGLKFKDITASSGIGTNRWCTGVSFVDINTDGFLDIYVSVAGADDADLRANYLFVNNGDESFTDMAESYGLADTAYTTHATFLDYDLDGDLDAYLLNHDNQREALNTPLPKKLRNEAPNTDRLYRNNGDHTFSDVSKTAGISIEGFGLGVTAGDINNDGWPDIYVSNDFISNDLLYINNGQGGFNNRISTSIQEQTYNGMGNDLGDINNDGLEDIVVVDMLPPDPIREKTMAGSMTADKFQAIISMGYEPQFMRNTLQLNQGDMNFIEIGRFAGIYKTDWSWAPLLADFNNDGWKDLYITNGYLKDITNKDFIDYNTNLSMFKLEDQANQETLMRIEQLNGVKLSNYLYINQGDLTFTDQTEDYGAALPSFSNGVVYADLDNDGDLDLAVNNINGPAFLFRNEIGKSTDYLQLQLIGPSANPRALGAKVHLQGSTTEQTIYKTPFRGFMSSVSDIIHFGLGTDSSEVSLTVTWPNGYQQEVPNLKSNQRITLQFEQHFNQFERADAVQKITELTIDREPDIKLSYTEQIDEHPDFKKYPLLPYRLSSKGPAMAVGDLDGNGLEDLFVGGGLREPGFVFYQQPNGEFQKFEVSEVTDCEVTDANIFDANGDNINDLYVCCGGIAWTKDSPNYQDQLFLGVRNSSIKLASGWLSKMNTPTTSLGHADFDNDGDTDLFIGGHAVPGNFPETSRSYLLRNEGNRFEDVTNSMAPELKFPGLINHVGWGDLDNDGAADLFLAGEWTPLLIFSNTGKGFENNTADMGLQDYTGWWQSLYAGDFDQDGDLDLLCGNVGLNVPYQASVLEPVKLYVTDFDNDKIYDPIMTSFIGGVETVNIPREIILSQKPFLSRKFPDHLSFASATITDIIPESAFNQAKILTSKTFASMLLVNSEGKFKGFPLPAACQLLPLRTAIVVNEDHNSTNLIVGGGNSNAEFNGTGYGASNAVFLNIQPDGMMNTSNVPKIKVTGDITSTKIISSVLHNELLMIGIKESKMQQVKVSDVKKN